MMYLCIIFVPPVYFIARRKWSSFVLNSVLYGIACLFLITIVFAFVAIPFWMLSVGHAAFSYRKELLSIHADMIASKMAEKLQNQPKNSERQ